MTDKKNEDIVLSKTMVASLKNILLMGEINPFSKEALDRQNLIYELSKKLLEKERMAGNITVLQKLDIVEPKPACNTLRAGNTAYGQALVREVDPLLLESLDGKHQWKDAVASNFTVVGARVAELSG